MNIDNCVQESLTKLSAQEFDNGHKNKLVSMNECKLFMWPQEWSDSSCGHKSDGMMCCPMITNSSCLVVIGPMGDACVYHNQKFAYKIDVPGEDFWQGVEKRMLPGATEILDGHVCLEKTMTV